MAVALVTDTHLLHMQRDEMIEATVCVALSQFLVKRNIKNTQITKIKKILRLKI